VAQVAEALLSDPEGLSSIPSTTMSVRCVLKPTKLPSLLLSLATERKDQQRPTACSSAAPDTGCLYPALTRATLHPTAEMPHLMSE
jgi:hypothetical protein